MKILITGINGFIGKNLFHHFSKDHHIIPFFRGDKISNISEVNPDIIIHSAAEIYKEDRMFDSNIKLTYDILKASLNLDYKLFIYIGSSSEYGRKYSPFKETDFLDPTTLYEATKGCATLLCQAFAKTYKKPIYVIRPFSLYGRYEPEHRLIPTLVRSAFSGETINLASASHDFIYIDDFIKGISHLINLDNTKKTWNIINFGTGVQHTNIDALRAVEKVTGKKINYKKVERLREFDSNFWVCNTEYALKEYGLSFKTSLTEGLRRYVGERKFT